MSEAATNRAELRNDDLTVIIPTWNSETRLERALHSVELNMRPGRVIVVDRESEDSTRQIASAHNAEVLTDTVSLGSARMRGVRSASSPWVCFVDDDISIPEGFMAQAKEAISEDVGAWQGAVVSVHQPYRGMLIEEYESRFSGSDTYDLRPGERGLTSATLVRRELIEDMELADMNTWEDWLITQKVIGSGRRWVVSRPYVDHYHEYEDLARKAGWNAAGILNLGRTGRMPPLKALRWYANTLAEIPSNALRLTVRYHDPVLFLLYLRLFGHVLMAPRHLIGVVPRRVKG
jgi:glycosyltransferase involved in cell wall biosynthesis